jgi:hypothetical protein
MTIEIVPEFFIHVTADNGKLLTNGEVETKEIFAPLNSDITNWVEIDEPIEILPNDITN